MSKRILIIEDEESISDLLAYSLKKEGYITKTADTGSDGIAFAKSFMPDLILLDLMLPDMSGFDVCKIVSKDFIIPIIMLTAKNDTVDKILGMELGADDYITKPFDMREVIVRIKSIFRRIELIAEANNPSSVQVIALGNGIEIFKDRREVFRDGNKLEFKNKEYDVLLYLSENRGRVVSRGELLDKVWGFEFIGDTRTVDIHIQRIRKKLSEDKNTSIIETVFGIGYKLV